MNLSFDKGRTEKVGRPVMKVLHLIASLDTGGANMMLYKLVSCPDREACETEDIPRLTAALDIASTASTSEAFPLVIGEATACGVPCVVTDVGDSAIIVGETGVVVPPKDPRALADGWAKLLLGMSVDERLKLGLAARQRIVERYSLGKIVQQYERLYESLER